MNAMNSEPNIVHFTEIRVARMSVKCEYVELFAVFMVFFCGQSCMQYASAVILQGTC